VKIPFASHLGTKVMALVLAVFLWGFAYLENLKDVSISYVLTLDPPEGLKIDERVKRFEIAVRGPRKIVEPLSREPEIYIKKQIDAKELEGFEDADTIPLTLTLTPEDLNADPSLIFPNLPMPVQVTLRRIDTRLLPVELKVVGEPQPGYVYVPEASYAWPRSVRVTGPKSMLDEARSISTEDFDITGLSSTLERADWPLVDEIEGEQVRLTEDSVYVQVVIRRELTEKTLEVPIEVLAPPGYPYRLNSDRTTATVTVEGPAEAVADIDEDDVHVFYRVDDSMAPRDVPYPADLYTWLPGPGDLSARVNEETVNVKVEPATP